jgi:hypothetical protein
VNPTNDVNRDSLLRRDGMAPRQVTPHQSAVLADLATVLQIPGTKSAAMATIIAGRMNDLEPRDFRATMAALTKYAFGSSLDVIGGLYELPRWITNHGQGLSAEGDKSFSARLIAEIKEPAPRSASDQMVGISVRAVLHLYPRITMGQRNNAIRTAIKDVVEQIQWKEAGETFTVNDVCFALGCGRHVIDVGEPNRPLEEIRLWRGARGETRRGQDLTVNYIINPGELLVAEPSIPAPIDIRVGRS